MRTLSSGPRKLLLMIHKYVEQYGEQGCFFGNKYVDSSGWYCHDRVSPFWSLLDMVKTYGVGLSQIGGMLAALRTAAQLYSKAPESFEDADVALPLTVLKSSRKVLAEVGLHFSCAYLKRTIATWEACGLQKVHADGMLKVLHERVEDELSQVLFMHFTPENASLYQAIAPFGKQVKNKFPSCSWDIEEAGRCLAVRRPTACVFHLMRVMEAGLRATSRALGIPYAPSWESHLRQINSKVTEKHKTKGIRWKRDEAFFTDVAARLEAVKYAWRNPTMHIVRKYTEEEAMEVYEAARMFMRHLATRLNEK